MITHLEPNILECEVERALASIFTNKASGGDRIPVELFQNVKDDAVEESTCLTSDSTTKPQSSRQYGTGTKI